MLPNNHLKKTATIALALGAITPAAAIAKELGTNGFGETSPHQTPTVQVTRHAHDRPIPFCRAVLDPMTGQMHGGCPPDDPNLDAATR
jgi:hypothetical protein